MIKFSKQERQIVGFFAKYIIKFKKNFLIITMLMLFSTLFNLYLPLADKALLDEGLVKKDFHMILSYLLIILAVKIASDGVAALQDLLSSYITNKFVYSVSKDAFGKMIRFPLSFFEKFDLGELTSRLDGDIRQTTIIVSTQLIDLVRDACILCGIIIIMAKMNLGLFLLSLLAVPMIVIVNLYIARRQKSTTRVIRSQYDRKAKRLQEVILGIQEVKAFNIFKWIEQKFINAQAQIVREDLRITKLVAVIFFLANGFDMLIHTIVYLYGGYLLIKGQLSIGELFAFLAYFSRSINILERMVNFNRMFQSALVSMERVYEIFKYKSEDIPLLQAPTSLEIVAKTKSKLCFEHVNFTYADSTPVINDLCFDVYSGEKVALVGANGSGKSTILKLLTGLLQPTKGSIYADGFKLDSFTKGQLARKIVYITQKPFIFGGTIKENLLLGNRKFSDKEIVEVIKQVGLQEFVQELPEGFNTPLTMTGTNLSGGQLQRLAIARAMLRKSEILLLDEPTSNIEEIFEEEFICNLVSNMPDQTILMTVHKRSLLKHFDRVLCLEAGQLYEEKNTFTVKQF